MQTYKRRTYDAYLNIPVYEETKILLAAYSRAIGHSRHTEVARALLMRALHKAIEEMSPEDRKILESVAKNTIIANRIEEIMLDDLKPI